MWRRLQILQQVSDRRQNWPRTYYSGYSKELIKNLDKKIVKDYVETMNRLETDFELQAELGIGL